MLSRLLKSRSLGARHGLLSKRLFTAHTVVPPPTVPIPKSAFVLDNEPAPLIKAHHDYKAIRQNAETIKENMKNRNYTSVDVDEVVKLIEERNSMIIPIQELRTRRKVVSDAVFTIMSKKKGNAAAELPVDLVGMDAKTLMAEGTRIKDEIARLEAVQADVMKRLETLALKLPNDTHPQVPIGGEENAKLLDHVNPDRGSLESFHTQGFVPRDHVELARIHGLLDLENASKVTGSRFYYLLKEAALLELALTNWTMQKLVAKGYTPILPPDLARTAVIEGAGFQSKDERTLAQHIYQIENADTALSATAEIPLAGRFMNQILSETELPIKMAAFNHCFRTEVGGLGLQTKGIYRVHQFSKVEMFILCTKEQADALHEELITIEKEIFSELGLNFKVLEMPTQDLGAPAYRKVDMEASMPGRALMLAATSIAPPAPATPAAAPSNKKKVAVPGAGKKADQAAAAAAAATAASSPAAVAFNVNDLLTVKPCFGEISSTSNCTDYQSRRLNIRYRTSTTSASTAGSIVEGAAPSDASGGVTTTEEPGGIVKFVYTLNGTACAVPRMILAILEQCQREDGTITIPEPLRPFMLGQSTIPFLPRK